MKIKELFDASKPLDRNIESVVTFGDNTATDLANEVKEYVVTEKLQDNYEKVLERVQNGFSDTANEVGIWVSGFYGSGKSSFAKYLGYSFDKSLMVDGISFGEKLMNRINDTAIKQLHRTIISRFNPLVIMIDLSTQGTTHKTSRVSDLMYYETLKAIGIVSCDDPKIIEFVSLLKAEDKYEEFCSLLRENEHKDWEAVQKNKLIANLYAGKYAANILPEYFSSKADFDQLKVDSVENEKERLVRLVKLVKKETGVEKLLFVIDEVGNYVASDKDLILSLQGTMQILKDCFRGDVWLIATAQQTLTEDSPTAQLNSNQLYTLNDRFPIKVHIEAEDIKEIITKRLLGKTASGKERLSTLFSQKEATIKLHTRLSSMERSRYIQPIDAEHFANLYPFLPVHIDILFALLQKLASRTGGVGLRSVIRLIRDILVENNLAEENVGMLATPAHFYDVLKPDMETNSDYKEIIISAENAMQVFSDKPLAVNICKAIAIIQILDDFALTQDNLCALLFADIDSNNPSADIRAQIEEIKATAGITLEEVEGRLRFMTNAILSIKEERNNKAVYQQQQANVIKELVADLLTPGPTVQIYGAKMIRPTVELWQNRRPYIIQQGNDVKIAFRFIGNASFPDLHSTLQANSIAAENKYTMYMLCILPAPIDNLITEIVKDEEVARAHENDVSKEVKDYVKSQKEDAKAKRQEVRRLLGEALNNSEAIYRGQNQNVTAQSYISSALRAHAEGVFHKYRYAAKSVASSMVKDLARYDNFASLPASLNPLNIVNSDGSINVESDSFREILDFISMTDSVAGGKLLDHFESAPYGWYKDTTRYIVALMLKAGKLILRNGATQYKLLTQKSAEEMKSNVLFNRLGIEKNDDVQITPQELMAVKNCLTQLFNPERLAPLADMLARAALKEMTGHFRQTAEAMARTFSDLGLAGADKVNTALAYAKRTIDSDGADAPILFAKEPSCFETMQYVMKVDKAERTAGLITNIKTLHHSLDEIRQIPAISQLDAFRQETNALEEAYNTLLSDTDCVGRSSDYADLLTRSNTVVKTTCADFCFGQNACIGTQLDEIRRSYGYMSLNDGQRGEVEALMATLRLDGGDGLISDLKMVVDEFSRVFIPGGGLERVKNLVARLQDENTPPTPPAQEPATGTVKRMSVKRQMKKTDAQQVLSLLQTTVQNMADDDTIELTLAN